jgi:hypothetical protein
MATRNVLENSFPRLLHGPSKCCWWHHYLRTGDLHRCDESVFIFLDLYSFKFFHLIWRRIHYLSLNATDWYNTSHRLVSRTFWRHWTPWFTYIHKGLFHTPSCTAMGDNVPYYRFRSAIILLSMLGLLLIIVGAQQCVLWSQSRYEKFMWPLACTLVDPRVFQTFLLSMFGRKMSVCPALGFLEW